MDFYQLAFLFTICYYLSHILMRHLIPIVLLTVYIKAFDTVSRPHLLLKLRQFGFTGHLWDWSNAYLTSREQCVCINDATSGFLPVASGVPQGSVIGPLLFLIYINDLPLNCLSKTLFADDSKCFCKILDMTDCHELQSSLNTAFNWSTRWELNFNLSKTALVRFSSSILTLSLFGTPLMVPY